MHDTWYELEPEVPGQWGDETVADSSSHPPVVSQLHLVFDGWLGDDIIESFPCYLVTEQLANALTSAALTGFEMRDVFVECSDTFKEIYPNRDLPEFRWLHVHGTPGSDDFGVSRGNTLLVSAAAFAVLTQFQFNNCDVVEVGRTRR